MVKVSEGMEEGQSSGGGGGVESRGFLSDLCMNPAKQSACHVACAQKISVELMQEGRNDPFATMNE